MPEPVSCTRPPDRLCVRACLCVRVCVRARTPTCTPPHALRCCVQGLGEAETMTSITSWRRHLVLWNNAQKFAFRAHVLQMITYLFGVITVVLATMYPKYLPRSFRTRADPRVCLSALARFESVAVRCPAGTPTHCTSTGRSSSCRSSRA